MQNRLLSVGDTFLSWYPSHENTLTLRVSKTSFIRERSRVDRVFVFDRLSCRSTRSPIRDHTVPCARASVCFVMKTASSSLWNASKYNICVTSDSLLVFRNLTLLFGTVVLVEIVNSLLCFFNDLLVLCRRCLIATSYLLALLFSPFPKMAGDFKPCQVYS